MVIEYREGASIEGLRLALSCRRLQVQPPYRHRVLNQLVYGFQMSIEASAFIDRESQPKEARIHPSSLLNQGDGLRGEMISGFSVTHIPRHRVQHRTSAHKGQFVETRDFSFAHLDRAWQSLRRRQNVPLIT